MSRSHLNKGLLFYYFYCKISSVCKLIVIRLYLDIEIIDIDHINDFCCSIDPDKSYFYFQRGATINLKLVRKGNHPATFFTNITDGY